MSSSCSLNWKRYIEVDWNISGLFCVHGDEGNKVKWHGGGVGLGWGWGSLVAGRWERGQNVEWAAMIKDLLNEDVGEVNEINWGFSLRCVCLLAWIHTKCDCLHFAVSSYNYCIFQETSSIPTFGAAKAPCSCPLTTPYCQYTEKHQIARRSHISCIMEAGGSEKEN